MAMRILLTTDTVGGVWDYTSTLSHELSRGGYRVLLAIVGDPKPERLAELPATVEVESRDFALEWMPNPGDDVDAAGEWLVRLAERWSPDLVHLNQVAYGARSFPAPVLVAVHSDVLSWLREVRREPSPRGWDRYRRWIRDGLQGADLVVTPTRYQSDLLERSYGRGADRIIHNGIQPRPLEPSSRCGSLLLSVGRAWDEAKGMRVFDQAVGELGVLAPPAHLLGPLEGPSGERYHPRHLVGHGRVDRGRVSAWMSRASIYVGASLYEPFGLAPAEAAMHGCALVLSDIGSFRELWSEAALFFRPGDPLSLADALVAASEPARCERLGCAARARALERYSEEHFGAAYRRLYRELAAGSRTSPPVERQAVLAI